MIENTKFGRRQILERVHHNVLMIPEELVARDYVTDSLLLKPMIKNDSEGGNGLIPKAIALEIEKHFKEIFGFPFVVPVSQGRVAEAMLGRLLVRNGHTIPGSALFPTTRIHQQLNGGTPIEVTIPAADEDTGDHSFKGNLDLEVLEKVIATYHARWIPFICVEPCTNAIGGQPISMENMKEVSRIAKRHAIPVYLDTTRLMENAFFIQEREAPYKNKPVLDIVREFCSYADGCTMSAMKNFPTPIGGFFATRDESLYHQALDFVTGFGSGLSFSDKKCLDRVLSDTEGMLKLVKNRMVLVRLLHGLIQEVYPVLSPVGGHGVFIDAGRLSLEIPEALHPYKAFLYSLYKEYGIRASENPQSLKQEKENRHIIRFAIPIVGESEASIRRTARDLLQFFQKKNQIEGLEKTLEPPGFTGAFRAHFRPVQKVSKLEATA